jgi:hypothetical protein
MKPKPTRTTEIDEIKDKYGLLDLEENIYQKGYQINRIQEELHHQLLQPEIDLTEKLNTLALGVRIQETITRKAYDQEDLEYITLLREEYNHETAHFSERFNILFNRYDFIIDKLDQTLTAKSYYAEETPTGGIFSTLIADRIAKYDQNFIFGMHGLPRAGKSKGALRIGTNITTKTSQLLDQEITLEVDDIVYDKESYLNRLEYRSKRKILKGSVIALEEAGDQLNSQKWWDEDVQGAVSILQQQGYQNTCLIIISQLHTDVVKKGRGLFHAALTPWKDLYTKSIDIDEGQHIDFERGISKWKLDLMDVDTMTGKSYPKGIRVALGKLRKLGIHLPPAQIMKDYDKKDHKYKNIRRKKELKKAISEKLQDGDIEKITQIAQEIISKEEYYLNKRGTFNQARIENQYNIGGRIARRIADKANELKEKKENEKEDKKLDE